MQGGIRSIGPNETVVFLDLPPGQHLITLKGVAEQCVVDGGNPQPRTVVPGKTVLARLKVIRGPPEPVP